MVVCPLSTLRSTLPASCLLSRRTDGDKLQHIPHHLRVPDVPNKAQGTQKQKTEGFSSFLEVRPKSEPPALNPQTRWGRERRGKEPPETSNHRVCAPPHALLRESSCSFHVRRKARWDSGTFTERS